MPFFGLLWLCTIGGSFVSPFFIHASHIAETKECLVDVGLAYSAGVVSVAVNTSITYVAISSQLMKFTQADTLPGRFNAYLHIRALGEITRRLMESGRQFVTYVYNFPVYCNS